MLISIKAPPPNNFLEVKHTAKPKEVWWRNLLRHVGNTEDITQTTCLKAIKLPRTLIQTVRYRRVWNPRASPVYFQAPPEDFQIGFVINIRVLRRVKTPFNTRRASCHAFQPESDFRDVCACANNRQVPAVSTPTKREMIKKVVECWPTWWFLTWLSCSPLHESQPYVWWHLWGCYRGNVRSNHITSMRKSSRIASQFVMYQNPSSAWNIPRSGRGWMSRIFDGWNLHARRHAGVWGFLR